MQSKLKGDGSDGYGRLSLRSHLSCNSASMGCTGDIWQYEFIIYDSAKRKNRLIPIRKPSLAQLA